MSRGHSPSTPLEASRSQSGQLSLWSAIIHNLHRTAAQSPGRHRGAKNFPDQLQPDRSGNPGRHEERANPTYCTYFSTGAFARFRTSTTVSSILLDQGGPGWELHADDYVFLSSSADTYAYPSRSHLYADYLKAVPSVTNKLSARQRAHLNVFGTVRWVSGDRIKWPLRVEPGLLWPERVSAPHAQLQALLLLESGRAEEINLEPISDSAALVDQLLQVNFYATGHVHMRQESLGAECRSRTE